MKRWILTALLLTLTLAAQAQYIQRKGGNIVQNGEKLSQQQITELLSDVDGTDYTASWKAAKAGRGTGIGLTIGGGVVAGVGAGVFLTGAIISVFGGVIGGPAGAAAGVPWMNGGLITAGAGVVSLAVGIPLLAVNCKKMNGIVGAYNAAHAPAEQQEPVFLSFGPTDSGVGLCLNF